MLHYQLRGIPFKKDNEVGRYLFFIYIFCHFLIIDIMLYCYVRQTRLYQIVEEKSLVDEHEKKESESIEEIIKETKEDFEEMECRHQRDFRFVTSRMTFYRSVFEASRFPVMTTSPSNTVVVDCHPPPKGGATLKAWVGCSPSKIIVKKNLY